MDTLLPNNEKLNNPWANKPEPNKPLSQVYQETYESMFSKLSQDMQTRVLAVKCDKTVKDRMVETFIEEVIAKAEAQESKDKPLKKDKKEVSSVANPS